MFYIPLEVEGFECADAEIILNILGGWNVGSIRSVQ